jgi:hypothetical protein
MAVSGGRVSRHRCTVSEELQRCNRRFFGTPHPADEVMIAVNVSADGQVVDVRAAASTLHDPEVEHCVEEPFRAMRFPPPNDGKEASFSYPVLFFPP